MKRKYIFTAVLLAALTVAGAGVTYLCGSAGTTQTGQGNEKPFKVVTSFYPVYIAAENVIGDVKGVELDNLTEPQTGCLHDYQLTPQNMISLSDADLFLINGGGIESFISDVFDSYPDLPVAQASEGISLLETVDGQAYELDAHAAEEDHDRTHTDAEEDHAHTQEDAHDHEGHDHGDVNAHVWMDVGRYESYVENIAKALAAQDPAHADAYESNAAAYKERLEKLRVEMDSLKDCAQGEKIILFHDAFAYFADMTGMEISYIIDMDENTSLSAREVSEVVNLVKEDGIDLLFTEEQYGTKLADAVSRETDAQVYVLDSLVSGSYDADSYITGMEQNLKTLQEAFAKGGK